MNSYFLDTYALIEILKKNENYKKYSKGILLTTKLNLMELHYYVLRHADLKTADKIINDLLGIVVDVDDEIYRNASSMKYYFKNQKISFVDCIGYLIAKNEGVKFLTGDNQFKGLDNVEFVK